MADILTNYDLSGTIDTLMIGGAVGGMLLAGEELGYNFAAILGGLFGPAGVIPGAILGLIVLNLLSNV